MSWFLALRALPWKLIGFAALALLVGSLMLALKLERSQNGKLKAQIEKCSDARQADRRAYEAAQREAAERNKATVARIESEQEHVTHEVQADLTARLERLRRELRNQAPSGSAGGTSPAPNGEPRPGTPQASGVCLAPEELLRAAENEERHDQLINWIEKQLGVKR